jgi:hypothetical protein
MPGFNRWQIISKGGRISGMPGYENAVKNHNVTIIGN